MTAQELKPCPFCGGRAEFDEHDEECYFTKLRALKKSKDPADMNPIMELIPAWNRRQPVARTPLSDGEAWEIALNSDNAMHAIRLAEAAHGITKEKQG